MLIFTVALLFYISPMPIFPHPFGGGGESESGLGVFVYDF